MLALFLELLWVSFVFTVDFLLLLTPTWDGSLDYVGRFSNSNSVL